MSNDVPSKEKQKHRAEDVLRSLFTITKTLISRVSALEDKVHEQTEELEEHKEALKKYVRAAQVAMSLETQVELLEARYQWLDREMASMIHGEEWAQIMEDGSQIVDTGDIVL